MTKKKEQTKKVKTEKEFSFITEEVVDEKKITGDVSVKPVKHTFDEEVK